MSTDLTIILVVLLSAVGIFCGIMAWALLKSASKDPLPKCWKCGSHANLIEDAIIYRQQFYVCRPCNSDYAEV